MYIVPLEPRIGMLWGHNHRQVVYKGVLSPPFRVEGFLFFFSHLIAPSPLLPLAFSPPIHHGRSSDSVVFSLRSPAACLDFVERMKFWSCSGFGPLSGSV